MSKIQQELMEACEISERKIKDLDRQAILKLILAGTNEMSDKEFDKLSDEAADWCNAAADAINAKAKELPEFPDFKAPGDDEGSSRRRRASSKEDEADTQTGSKEITDAKKGQAVRILTKRGKDVSGHVVEIDKEVIVIKTGDGDEQEFDRDRIEKMYGLAEEGSSRRKADDAADDPIKVGAEVKVVTKRGKEVTGKIVELNEDLLVIDDGKEEVEFDRDRVESITPVKAAKEEGSGRRRSSAKDEKEDKGEGKNTRVSNEAGVSVGTRIKELLAEDTEMSMEDIGKRLDKEGIAYKENTLQLNYRDCTKFLEVLKAAKRLK